MVFSLFSAQLKPFPQLHHFSNVDINRRTKYTLIKICSIIQHTCLPTACVADFPAAAVGFSCVAGIPEAQVTTKTLHSLYFFFL